MPPAPVLLLPPSEGKAPGGGRPAWPDAPQSFPELLTHRVGVRDAVRSAIRGGDAERLLGVRGPHLERALAEWTALDDAPTLPAHARYSGVVWGALDPAGLDAASRRRLLRRVLVPSGLWGLVAAGDRLPAYRLKMGARVPPLGPLAAYWRPLVTPLVAARAGRGWIIDLLPEEHAAVLDPALLEGARRVRVELRDGPGGRAAGHAGKAAKGRLARAVLEADVRDPAGLLRLRVPGLRADPDAGDLRATPARVVFVQ